MQKGPYLRHLIAVLVGAIVSFAASKGISLSPDIQSGLELTLFGIGYAFVEKFLKNFPKLDPIGHAEKVQAEAKAVTMEKQGKI